MRFGGLLSVVLHVGFAVAGMIAAPFLVNEEASHMMIIPLDLEVADTTNIRPITEHASEEDKAEEIQQVESFSASKPPPAPAANEEFLPDEKTEPEKKPDPKKAEANAAPAKKEETPQTALQSINSIIGKVDRSASETSADPAPKSSMRGVEDAGPRKGAGDQKKMSATIADMIMSQLLARRCWGDQSDMADARRLSAVIEVQFNRDGHFRGPVKLVEPNPRPTNDPPMQVYIQRAYDALNKCNTQGFQVPKEYFDYNPPLIIQLQFKP